MKNKLQNSKLYQIAKQHPKITSAVGTIFTTVILKTCDIIDEVNLNQIMEWISKIKSLIQNGYFLFVIVIIVILLYVYKSKKLDIKKELEDNTLKSVESIIQNNTTISDVDIDINNDNISISIKREKTGKNKDDKDNKDIINFPASKLKENN